jgi:predicted acylesterase/phospholipase RssA
MAYAPAYNPEFGQLGREVAKRWPEEPVIAEKGKRRDTLGLALSGGGYRSAIFGYGILQGLREIGVLDRVDYLSVVSGGSWIGTPFCMAEDLKWFFHADPDSANFMEEAFESLLVNPLRVVEELALTRLSNNYISDLFGRLLARTFLREYGDYSRFKPLCEPGLVRDGDRPFLIVNGTVNFRRPGSFDITQECFEMTRLYCGSRSLGYLDSEALCADQKPIRVRDAIAMSGAAVAVHVPGIGSEVAGLGLSREIANYPLDHVKPAGNLPRAERLDVADGGHYNNLGVESLVNRGCGYIILVDAEHDPESRTRTRSNQKYEGLRTLMSRNHIPQPAIPVDALDRADEPVHLIAGSAKVPDILYVKLKSWTKFDRFAAAKPYNKPGFLKSLFSRGDFSFDPQFSTAKLDYSFAEHRNLSDLGAFVVRENAATFRNFSARAK